MRNDFSEKIYIVLLALSLAGIVMSVLLQVFFRYFLKSPLIWTDEFSRLSFCWFTFTGSALASHDDKHLEVNFFYNKFSSKAKKAVHIFNHSLIFVFSCFLLYYTFIQILLVKDVRSAATRMPIVFFTIPIFLGFIGIAYYRLYSALNYKTADFEKEGADV